MKRTLLIVTVLLLLGAPLFADFSDLYYNLGEFFSGFADPNTGLTAFPTLLIPMGGKYEGMGTAYTAVALDSGFLEANPSASSSLDLTELSFYHHSWIADSNLEGVVYTARYDDLGIGVGGKFLYVPFTEYNEWGDRENRGYISETVATFNVSYNFFSDFDFYGLGLGANLKTAYRNIPAVFYPDQSVLTAMVDLGILTRFNFLKFHISRAKNFSVGAVVKNIGLPALGEPLPTLATVGFAWAPIRPLTWAVDFNLPFSFSPEEAPAETWSLATGFNVVVTNFLSIQTGFRWKADNPRISLGSSVDLEKISFVLNYNLDLSGRVDPLDKFSLQAKLNLGDRGRGDDQRALDDLYLKGLESYAAGDLRTAIDYWEQVLEIDPSYAPARANIETAEKALELQSDMEEQLKIGD
jgi:tetratricopeptide (TPR) repeat protein